MTVSVSSFSISGGGGGVTTITGTANQITASAPSGAVTLSIPAVFIAPGSVAASSFSTTGSITWKSASPFMLDAQGINLSAVNQIFNVLLNNNAGSIFRLGNTTPVTWFNLVGSTGIVTVPRLVTTAVTVANLPAAPVEGQRAGVTDSNAVSFTAGIGSIVAGGGATHVPVYFDGTDWRIG